MVDVTSSLISFLLEAKRQTYAAGNMQASVPAVLPGSHQLEFKQGSFFYRDVYYGGDFFAGQEVVLRENIPLWTMVYSGGLLAENAGKIPTEGIYKFLCEALSKVTPNFPYRGPLYHHNGEFEYTSINEGVFERFWGSETITHHSKPIYRLYFHGGWIKE